MLLGRPDEILTRVRRDAMVRIEQRLAELGITLAAVPAPLASYVPYTRSGNLVYTSGHVPFTDDMKGLHKGKVGLDFTVDEGAVFARRVGTLLLSTVQNSAGGDLDKVKKIVKIVGFVNCPADFTQQPEVINGCSNLLLEVFGEAGKHARSAVGTNSLPRNVPVEIEMIVELAD
jgi:enamine deaminase RidA (YjgF/YER057c/UK114 family)